MYRTKLNNIGMIDRKESVYHFELSKRFINYYPSEFLDYLKCSVDVNKNNDWLKKLTRKQYNYVHPLRHILFIRFLFGSVKEFYSFYKETKIKTNEPFGTGPWPCLNPVANHFKDNVIKGYKLSKNSKAERPIGVFECSCGYTYSKVASSNDSSNEKKVTIRFGQMWESKLKEYLLVNKYSINKISKILRCQATTILRCAVKLGLDKNVNLDVREIKNKIREKEKIRCKLEKNYKKDVISYIKENPQTYRSEVKYNLYKQFSWLRAHCKEWLNDNVPVKEVTERNKYLKKERVNWMERDKEVALKVQKIINEIKSKPKYRRITVGLISTKLNRFPFDKQLNKLPITKDVIEKNVESLEQSQKRRIIYIVDELFLTSEEVTRNKVIHKANLANRLTKELDQYICDLICTVRSDI